MATKRRPLDSQAGPFDPVPPSPESDDRRLTFLITSRRGPKALGILSWPSRSLTCDALSGDSAHDAINLGIWTGSRFEKKSKKEKGFCDVLGSCWFSRFADTYGRTAIGIHPDGGTIGATLGCIGLSIADSTAWREALKAVEGRVICEVLESSEMQILPDESVFEAF